MIKLKKWVAYGSGNQWGIERFVKGFLSGKEHHQKTKPVYTSCAQANKAAEELNRGKAR